MSELVLPKLSFKIMSVLFKVHRELGSTLLEKYYQRAIALELQACKLHFKEQISCDLQYRGNKIGKYFLDFIIEDLVILEIKAQPYFTPEFFKQTLAYLKQVNLPLGILANFRSYKLEYKRVINSNFENIDLSEKDYVFE